MAFEKTLIVIRHAKSSWDDPFQDDFDRPLNNRGRRDAPRMAKRLKEKKILPDFLLSSPANRALSTSMLIAEGIGYDLTKIRADRRLYHADDELLLKVIHDLKDIHEKVMLVAHNPALTHFANRISRAPVTENIPTCGIVAMRMALVSWKNVKWGTGDVTYYDYPKNRRS